MVNDLVGSFNQEEMRPAKLNTGRIALIDADKVKYVVAYKIYQDVQKIERGELQIFLKEDPVIKYTKQWISDFLLRIEDPMIFCFSAPSSSTFRCNVAFEKQYKGNRKKDYTEYDGKLQDMANSMKYIVDNYVSLVTTDLEADDILSMLQDPDNTYIISNDKDLKTVPGYHYDYALNNIKLIPPKDALYFLATQMITGDTTDSIPGLPGYGPVAAEKILAQCRKPSEYIARVLHEYQTKFGIFKGTDMFSESWMLLKMRENRGTHFLSKYERLFDSKTMLLQEIQKNKLK